MPKDNEKREICIIRLMFPVVNDEQALQIKAKIKEALKDAVDAETDFRIMPVRGYGRNV